MKREDSYDITRQADKVWELEYKEKYTWQELERRLLEEARNNLNYEIPSIDRRNSVFFARLEDIYFSPFFLEKSSKSRNHLPNVLIYRIKEPPEMLEKIDISETEEILCYSCYKYKDIITDTLSIWWSSDFGEP